MEIAERRRLGQKTTPMTTYVPLRMRLVLGVCGFRRPRGSAAPGKVPALKAEMGSESGAGPEPAIRRFPAPLPAKAWHCGRSRSSELGRTEASLCLCSERSTVDGRAAEGAGSGLLGRAAGPTHIAQGKIRPSKPQTRRRWAVKPYVPHGKAVEMLKSKAGVSPLSLPTQMHRTKVPS